jgi:hypothetical protein
MRAWREKGKGRRKEEREEGEEDVSLDQMD